MLYRTFRDSDSVYAPFGLKSVIKPIIGKCLLSSARFGLAGAQAFSRSLLALSVGPPSR
jgi:hypothetical protein